MERPEVYFVGICKKCACPVIEKEIQLIPNKFYFNTCLNELCEEYGWKESLVNQPPDRYYKVLGILNSDLLVNCINDVKNLIKNQKENKIDLVKTIEGVDDYFEGEYHRIVKLVEKDVIPKDAQYQDYDGLSYFDHCYVDQRGSSDDFHGNVYFHIIGDMYLEVEY
jgi:hypothetical protein